MMSKMFLRESSTFEYITDQVAILEYPGFGHIFLVIGAHAVCNSYHSAQIWPVNYNL